MTRFPYRPLLFCLVVPLFSPRLTKTQEVSPHPPFPCPEKLTYNVQWRLVNAGTATVQLSRHDGSKMWDFTLNIETAGLVSRLYRVADAYKVATSEPFCLVSSSLNAQEGKKRTRSITAVENGRRRLAFEEQDLVKNRSEKKELEIPACTYEIVGALATLRTLNLAPGKVTTMPITDGKKVAQAKIEAQAKERVTVAGKDYSATRYEAFLFDNVLYRRRGRLMIWIGDGPEHLPLRFRLSLGFPIGTITVELQKEER
jgi:hypothetical protein